MSSITMTVRLDSKLKTRLSKLANATSRTPSYLASEAISEYLKNHEWQLSEIKKGIAEADAEQLIDHKEIVKMWEKKYARSLDKKRKSKSRAA